MRIVRLAVGIIFGLILLDFILLGGQSVVLPFYLVCGWIFFLKRTLPEVAFNPSGIALALLCSAIVLAGMHWFCTWFYSRSSPGVDDSSGRKWEWRWTFGSFLLVCLLFVSSIASTGVFHQVGWLITSKEPFFVNRAHRVMLIIDLKQIATELTMAADEQAWKPEETKVAWASWKVEEPIQLRSRRPILEDWHFVFLEDEKKKFACVIFHRDPKTRAKIGFALIADQTQVILPKDKLTATLARFGITTAPTIR